MGEVYLYISQSNDKKFHYNIKANYQYLCSSYDRFDTYEQAELEGSKKLNKIIENK